MDMYPNAEVSGGKATAGRQPETRVPSTADSSIPGEFFLGGIEEGGDDVSLEWLSMFVEDCFSTTPSYPTTSQPPTTTLNPNPPPSSQPPKPAQPSSPHDHAIPSKARTKRKKLTPFSDPPPPLLHQTHWLADSELIFPKREDGEKNPAAQGLVGGGGVGEGEKKEGGQQQQSRRCSHCLSQRTPQWRAGPLGPKTLCNACGVRFKSGRLLPEYRPAKSPTFVSYKHSNSHKKVMEMRMDLPSHSK